MVAGRPDTGPYDRALVSEAFFGAAQRDGQRGEVAAAQVGEFDPLRIPLGLYVQVSNASSW
ncbi:MAG: hypothetical protein ACXWQR_06570 [Ktedonobacterales bacterium]